MNVKQVVIAMSILASGGGAMAVDATQWNPSGGYLSRAEVKAELARAIAGGELHERGETYAGYVDTRTPATTLTRADVKEQLAHARANGELDGRGEAYGGFPDLHPRNGEHVFAWRKPHASTVN